MSQEFKILFLRVKEAMGKAKNVLGASSLIGHILYEKVC
jgi:hypothetical protein